MASEPSLSRNFASAPRSIAKNQQQFLQFLMEPDTLSMLPMAQLSEVLTIPLGQIIPIPHMPPWVMGVYNWRGEILWMLDLGHLLGLTPWNRQSSSRANYSVIVLNGNGDYDPKNPPRRQNRPERNQMLGLVVTKINDIEWCDPDDIQSAPGASVSSLLIPYLRGFWVSPGDEMFVVLNGQAIISQLQTPGLR